MPRTPAEKIATGLEAERIAYIAPPTELEPEGALGQDQKWVDLVDFWYDQDVSWGAALLVYISDRFDVTLEQAYADTDSFAKSMTARFDRLEDPDAVVSFN
ncbi:hypothetical protein [Pelagibacterium halotolerans]|uniref:Uncharacterized protein n=1 Tax=Pelagibacterium halotolerans (strain DSM 22347 / JCM 15775 / CGMCC 1.7692 / B2) TaxID=1082931 RepID=G4RBI7_PELHB|nr:hypothetical protein [Pelagibacterium halotolerans]AEQ52663.1 hypothetical protein KKY_2655 [Pelagibacterium halotolerans B2]QJR17635.1 hypothetical protein HKM20_03770 [Pelagibacterium halotolerans]SEA84032.1 hypothetical protein SAMN05428936_10957 [Pelagibacterium halotolerans]